MDEIELQDAYCWTCPKCEVINFGVPKQITNTVLRKRIIRDLDELEDWEELPEGWEQMELWTNPDIVTCGTCSTEFSVIHPEDEEEDT